MKGRKGRTAIEDHRAEIGRCVKCGACSAVCPSFHADRRESRSPRGRIALIEAVLDGRLPASQAYRDRLATCTGCLACEFRCSSGVPVPALVQAAKEQAVREAGTGLIAGAIAATLRRPGLMRSLAWLAPVALHYHAAAVRGTQPDRRRAAGFRGQGRAGKVLFFPGCAIRYFQRDVAEASLAVLEELGYECIVPREALCCGRPFLSLGDRETARECAEDNTELLRSFDAEAVVTACASCGLTFKREYAALLAASGLKMPNVMDIHEFLADKLDRLEFVWNPGRYTVHDPCHLGRGQGLAGVVRSVLAAVPGLDLVEMGEPDRCCGFGGVMRVTHPELSRTMGSAKAADIAATGVQLAVTGCPSCRMQIGDALRRRDAAVEVMHTVQVIERALRRRETVVGSEDREPAGFGAGNRASGYSSRRGRKAQG